MGQLSSSSVKRLRAGRSGELRATASPPGTTAPSAPAAGPSPAAPPAAMLDAPLVGSARLLPSPPAPRVLRCAVRVNVVVLTDSAALGRLSL